MVSGKNGPGGGNDTSNFFALLAHLPSPEAMYKEIKRMNDNLERIQPDISKLANGIGTVNPQDLRNLTSAMQGIDASKFLLALNEANGTIKNLYNKLWGKP
jgi:hypothetical protein